MMHTEGSVSLLVGQCGIQVGDTIFDELYTSSQTSEEDNRGKAQTTYFSMKIERRGPFWSIPRQKWWQVRLQEAELEIGSTLMEEEK